MELMKLLKPLIANLRFFGICLQTPDMSKSSKISMIISVIFILTYTVVAPFYLIKSSTKQFKLSGKSLLFIIIYYGAFIVHALIIFETFFTRNRQFKFWNTLFEIENLNSNDKNRIQEANRCLKRRLIWSLLILTGFSLSCKFGLWIINRVLKVRGDWFMIDVTTTISQECCRLNFFSHFLFVEILRMHVRLFNEKVKEITKACKKIDEGALVKELNLLKLRHNLIWKLNRKLNSFFQWAQPFNFLHYFLNITNLLYWIYHGTINGNFNHRKTIAKFGKVLRI
uniref:Uncharacterized protein n=1 Tax=Lutzomyia longipalpis TaxID=7200 RepID=A0A240SXX5_LUTLO